MLVRFVKTLFVEHVIRTQECLFVEHAWILQKLHIGIGIHEEKGVTLSKLRLLGTVYLEKLLIVRDHILNGVTELRVLFD